MPPFGPVRRSELIRALRALGFDGPYSGGKHQFMVQGDIGRELLSRILRQAGVDRETWEKA
jgi:predicted RNA binding protein YcfA (HicA-like mRNA interferase family)